MSRMCSIAGVVRVVFTVAALVGSGHGEEDFFPTFDKHASSRSHFRAAVYDQVPGSSFVGYAAMSRREALAKVRPILDDYAVQAARAAEQGADILIFAEYGLIPRNTQRQTVLPFLESIPSPLGGATWNPCVSDRPNTEIQRALSCMARNNSLYVVANMGDVIYCAAGQGSCPRDGRLQYNTNVVFDPEGKLVARYHKQHLFFEWRYDTPPSAEISYFDTPFGRVGTFVCFDVLFRQPPIPLVEEFQIDHVAFPTAWMNVLPYFSAVPFHASFAMGHGVNFMAANLHQPSRRFSGSGVYAGNTTVAFRNDAVDEDASRSALIVAELPVTPVRIPRLDVRFTWFETDVRKDADFSSDVFGDAYSFVGLKGDAGRVMVCQQSVCCHLNYEKIPSGSGDQFVLGAFRGLHTREGTYFIEVCALMKCANNTPQSCGTPVSTSATFFSAFNLTGNFSTRYVYPQVTTDGVHPSPGQWHYDGKSVMTASLKRPFLSAVLFARRYDLDGIKGQFNGCDKIVCSTGWMALTLLFFFIKQFKLAPF